MLHLPHSFPLARLALTLSLAFGATAASAQGISQDQLLQKVEALTQELERVKTQLQQMQAVQKQQIQPAAPTMAEAVMHQAEAPAEPSTVISSYGEINYNRPKDGSQAQADIRRFVIGLQHRFDEKTKVVSELEMEHAVASSGDQGEVEVEQLYLEHRLNESYGLRAGLFLMPVGLLNHNHEPTAYYGVERNFVETAIIPTTWREGGLQVFGEHDNGVSWSAGLSTSFSLSKWDATSTEGRSSPLRSIHQEMQLAQAHDLAVFGNVDWRGIPGLRIGTSVFSSNISQAQTGTPDAHLSLWDAHIKWTPGPWDLSALYARGTITGAGALNAGLNASAIFVPNAFDGWYAQAAYRWQINGGYTLAPFTRYERYNTARGFDGLSPALNPGNSGDEAVTTVGLNFYLNPNVVLKTDVQHFKLNSGNNRVDFGIGYAF